MLVLPLVAGQVQRVGAAWHVRRDGPGEIGIPAAIVEIAVVELDRGVVLRGMAPAHFLPGPAGADHGAVGKVDEVAVAGLRAGVGDDLGRDADREIPGGEYGRDGDRPVGDEAREDGGGFELAGEVVPGGAGRIGREHDGGGAGKSQAGQLAARLNGVAGAQRLLADDDMTSCRVG